MNFLLKIVDGPMKGAEIALLGGRRTSVGSDESCDLVIADQALAAKAFELDVSETAVTLLVEGGEAKLLRPFEVHAFGTTAIAVGPAEGAWQPLVYPEKKVESEVEVEKKVEPGKQVEAQVEVEEKAKDKEEAPREKKRRRGLGCLFWLLLLALIVFLMWYFWGWIAERCPAVERCRVAAVERVKGWWGSGKALVIKPEAVIEKGPTLSEIADQYGLSLTPAAEGRQARLSGNVRLRTERMAIRALALADDAQVVLDLTDDESLRLSADESLFAVTEGAIKALSASNRVVTLSGYAPTVSKLEAAVRALNKDVPSIVRLDTAQVQVGGTPPAEVSQTTFVAAKSAEQKKTAAVKKAPSRPDYPIAGILTKPYPCVVLRNGMRLCEGAQVGTAVIVSIAADKLILREEKKEFEWKP